jgi:Family of unknown function (DUF6982)
VARYADGQVLKGYAGDFDPDQPRFHLVPAHGSPEDVVEVWLKDLKALFFVRSFEGDPRYVESRDPYRPRPPGTRKVSLEFQDGDDPGVTAVRPLRHADRPAGQQPPGVRRHQLAGRHGAAPVRARRDGHRRPDPEGRVAEEGFDA